MLERPSDLPRETISMTTLRVKTRDVVEKAYYAQNIFVVEAYGRPMVAIVGIDEFQKLMTLAAQADEGDKTKSPLNDRKARLGEEYAEHSPEEAEVDESHKDNQLIESN